MLFQHKDQPVSMENNRCLFGNQANCTMRPQHGPSFVIKTGGTSNT